MEFLGQGCSRTKAEGRDEFQGNSHQPVASAVPLAQSPVLYRVLSNFRSGVKSPHTLLPWLKFTNVNHSVSGLVVAAAFF